ncbi:MAG: PEGA domain-containing protein [Methanoregula sp.]|nr:PEGA domain-containing protein [Methanoregula sp.]
MSTRPLTLALLLIVLAIVSAGCTTPAAPSQASRVSQGNGTLHVSTVPAGAEVYLDGEYRSLTPSLIGPVPAGHHTLEFKKSGYESVESPVTIVAGGMEGVSLEMESIQTIIPANTTATGLPHIDAQGSWEYAYGFNSTADPKRWNSTTFAVPLVLHAEFSNGGTAGARQVTASANVYDEGLIVCTNPVDLGAIAVSGHVTREIQVTCMLPSAYTEQNIVVLVENVTVTQE